MLPGMDGTGILFDPFLEHAPPGVPIEVVRLPQTADGEYSEHAKYVQGLIGDTQVVLVAESYSGMIAYELVKMGCPGIKHIIFAASFISRPSLLARLGRHVPIELARSNAVPRAIAGRVLFGKGNHQALIEHLYRALNSVDASVLRKRLQQIASIPEPKHRISTPCTYIRPSHDLFISTSALNAFAVLCDSLAVHEVDGTHFILQTNPVRCRQIIQRNAELPGTF